MAETTERPLENISDAELFKAAAAPPPEEVVEETQPELPLEPEKPKPAEIAPATPEPTPSAEAAIPSWRLREEAEARRVAEDRARLLEGRLNEVLTHIQQQQKPPDFFDNPDKATEALINRALGPYVEAQKERERRDMVNSKLIAETRYGEDKVTAAEAAFMKAHSEGTLDPADYERVVGSPNRYHAAVQWHHRQSILTSVGDDPNAWFEKQLEARMADPAFQTQVLEKVRGKAASKPSTTKLPPSLSRVTAAANNAEAVGDLSDTSLWSHATRR